MRITYIFHSGFLVETEKSYYLFDYYRGEIPKLDIKKPIVLFISHAHRDHCNPEIFEILKCMGMEHIFAVLARDVPKKRYPEGVETCKACAGKTYALPGGEMLSTLASTDSGVAFLLQTSEGTIYHAGDLNDWSWEGEPDSDNRDMRERYRREIEMLRGVPIDVAFVPLDPRLESHYADGLTGFLSVANAKRVYPMHYWKRPEVIARFLDAYPAYRGVVQYTEEPEKGD